MQNSINPFMQSDMVLPTEIQTAIEAVNLPEIQEMLKKLSKYNLGICVPHKHGEITGGFEGLPPNEIQMENNLEVSFMDISEISKIQAVPVAWRWQEDGINASAMCVSGCVATDVHKTWHSNVK